MMPVRIDTAAPLRPVRGQVVPASIWDLLQWAFQRECARLDFAEVIREVGAMPGFGLEWVMMEQARLGCRVQGGGSSDPHPDADIVVSALASLPESYGGRRMAIQIAEGARVGDVPDWMPSPRPRCEPIGWKVTKHGRFGEREFWTKPGRWPAAVLGKEHGYACPVFFADTADQVARARRAYLQWWTALMALRMNLSGRGVLSAFTLTEVMPAKTPWCHGA